MQFYLHEILTLAPAQGLLHLVRSVTDNLPLSVPQYPVYLNTEISSIISDINFLYVCTYASCVF